MQLPSSNIMIDIRSYRMDDELEVIQLWKKVFPETPLHNDPLRDIQSKLKIQPGLFLVAVNDRLLVGSAMAGYDGHRGWIYYLAVDPAYRREGIGTALMKEAEGLLAQKSCPKLNLQIRENNSELQAFYEKLGYSVEERISMGKQL